MFHESEIKRQLQFQGEDENLPVVIKDGTVFVGDKNLVLTQIEGKDLMGYEVYSIARQLESMLPAIFIDFWEENPKLFPEFNGSLFCFGDIFNVRDLRERGFNQCIRTVNRNSSGKIITEGNEAWIDCPWYGNGYWVAKLVG